MIKRATAQLRPSAIAYVMLGVVVAGGGTYALAGTRTPDKTITVCVSKTTGVLRMKMHARCGRAQRAVSWNQRGPQGRRGAKGAPGAPAVNAWAEVASDGTVAGQNLKLFSHTSPGVYELAILGPCRKSSLTTSTATVDDSFVAVPPGSAPVVWTAEENNNTDAVLVSTGVITGGVFTPEDIGFSVLVTCGKGASQ